MKKEDKKRNGVRKKRKDRRMKDKDGRNGSRMK